MIRKRVIVMGAACLIISASVGRLCGALAQSGPPQITVTASFQEQQVAPGEQIELVLSRAIEPQEGRIAIFIGRQDLTALFSAAGDRLRYDPKLLPLPVGESEVIVYIVSAGNEWREIARFTLRVQAPQQAEAADESTENTVAASDDQAQPAQKRLGFEKLDAIPSITLNIKSQPAQSSFPDSNRPERPTFTDLTMQGSFRTEMARGPFSSQMQFDFVGSSFQNEALRFGDLGDRAPQIDLASYLMQFQTGRVKYQVGHFSFGTLRHLMNHSSRGVMLSLSAGPRADFSATVLNGSSIVGYDNFFGIGKRRHQIVSATLGFEFLPKRPGGLRVEVGALEGWVQPVSGFNQGAVNDAERSRGAGIRLLASDPSGRFRLESGFTRSQFFNPPDPLLDQGSGAIQVPPVTRNARYIDASFDVLKDLALFKDRRASLTVGFKHETVDPLYRSLGASTQADKAQNEVSLTGAIGDITAQFSHLRFNDNLANIPSILKSLTRASTFAASIPLASIFGDPAKPSPLLPRLSYNLSRTLQFG
ncbi:MAG TPA: hypothetical protein VNO14_06990, partial [Blastocatellia bacterium]|nr:hypothetical protein [Blastocatellia bacterium]